MFKILSGFCLSLAIGIASGGIVFAAADRNFDINANERMTYVEDGELSKQLHMPTYEWIPKGQKPHGMILLIHGLTLHGKRYDVLGKAFAAEGLYACSTDMHGFGRCYTDDKHVFDVGNVCKQKVNMEKSYEDLVVLARKMIEKYPGIPLFVVGESLGTSFCIKLAAEHPELVEGLLLSGPTVKVNPLMYMHPQNAFAALKALVISPTFNMSTTPFVKNLVSNDDDVIHELMEDPLCRKGLTIAELLQTQKFVSKTLKHASQIKEDQPILVLQGSKDKCMVPGAILKLSKNIRSSDQTIRWLYNHGHLLLETAYVRPATMDAIDIWVREHEPEGELQEKELGEDLAELGSKSHEAVPLNKTQK